jgi:hypothetical protein
MEKFPERRLRKSLLATAKFSQTFSKQKILVVRHRHGELSDPEIAPRPLRDVCTSG